MALSLAGALLAGPRAALADVAGSVGGVQKVMKMLTSISEKAKKEKADEEVEYAKFETWCGTQARSMKEDIVKNGQDVELLTSSVGKLQSDAKVLGGEIGKLNNDLGKFKSDEKAQMQQREKDYKDFFAQQKDFSESVDAVERAIKVLESKAHDVPGAQVLLQLSSESQLPARARSLVAAFLGLLGGSQNEDADFGSQRVPVADAYGFQSSSLIDMLKRLRDEFRGQLATVQKQEINSKHAFEMIMQDLSASIATAEKQVAEKTSAKLGREEKAALDKKQLAATTSVKAENEQTLQDLETECRQKKMSFEEKQNLRTEELEALAQALQILSSPEVLGGAQKHLGLAQTVLAGTSLAQIRGRRAATGVKGLHHRLHRFLASEGRRLHSHTLTLLAEQVEADTDTFGKVKSIISNMITKLQNEAHDDANHEGFCDAELGKSQLTRTKLSENIDALNAAIDGGKATILSLTGATAALQQEVTNLKKAVAEATVLRQEEKAKNAETVQDAEAGQAAVERATKVLKDFYAKALTATALLQGAAPKKQWGMRSTIKMGSPEWQALANPKFDPSALDTGHQEGMQTFGEVYRGAQDEVNNGVLALMEVIQSDFASLKVDTLATEAASQRSFEEFVRESNKNLAVKEKSIEMNNAERAAAELKVQDDTKELKGTEDELLAAERYHEQLVPQCIDQGVTFEERTTAREAEVASLKQALDLLASKDIA